MLASCNSAPDFLPPTFPVALLRFPLECLKLSMSKPELVISPSVYPASPASQSILQSKQEALVLLSNDSMLCPPFKLGFFPPLEHCKNTTSQQPWCGTPSDDSALTPKTNSSPPHCLQASLLTTTFHKGFGTIRSPLLLSSSCPRSQILTSKLIRAKACFSFAVKRRVNWWTLHGAVFL